MSISGIHGQLLQVTVVRCTALKRKEFISRQDPYVYVEYGDAKFRTKTCTDGGKNPIFQETFAITLAEGRHEMNVVVWNSHRFSSDDHIGSGRVPLMKVLREGYDDSCWPLQCKNGRHAGEISLILRCPNLNKHPPPVPMPFYPPAPYPPQPAIYQPPPFPPPPATYPPAPYPGQCSGAYPPY